MPSVRKPEHLMATIADLYRPIQQDLEKAELAFGQELASKYDFVNALTAHIRRYQGKRLRPALVFLAARACGEVKQAHALLAAALEMIHLATLVHDDVLDEATLRRHLPTVNVEWDNQTSVMLGDYLFTHAFHLTATTDSALACRWIGEATNAVCAGELRQIASRGQFNLTETEYESIIKGKTAELLACCTRIGAYFAETSAETVKQLDTYGESLGMAFQIADDILDILSTDSAAGKTVGSDLRMRKMTLPMIHFRDHATPAELERFRQLFEEPENANPLQIAELLEQRGSIRYARERACQFTDMAISAISTLPASDAKQSLEVLAQLVVNRMA